MSYLSFQDAGPIRRNAPTRHWWVWGQGVRLGRVRWYAPWRRYAFYPDPETVFEKDCLRELATFCEAQTERHKAGKEPE